jgi:hypothetical protein
MKRESLSKRDAELLAKAVKKSSPEDARLIREVWKAASERYVTSAMEAQI